MKRSFSFLFAIVLVGSVAFAQTTQPTSELEQNLRRHVEYLASDQLEGRKTGEAGATTAAGYVANQFAQFRLKPGISSAKGKGNFLQPFPYVAGVTIGESSFLRLIPADTTGESKLEPGITYMPYGNSINSDVPNAPLVFAGYGIATADKKYDDFSGLDANGKVLLVFDGTPEGGSRETFGSFNIHAKANLAKERGAKALIVIAKLNDFKADPLSRLVYEPTTGETAIPVVIVDRGIAAELLGAKEAKDLAAIEKSLAMKTNVPPNSQAETRPVGSVPTPIKATAQLKIDLRKKTVDAYNVIGILEGTDPVLKNEAIVIGAHYDHLGRGGRSSLAANSTDIHHGADDNASGTAAILELARQFAKEKTNKRTLIFMAFGGEEEGLLGSKFYVNSPVWPIDKTVAMINLDMVGRLKDEKLTVGGIGTAGEWRVLALETAVNQPMRLTKAGPLGGTVNHNPPAPSVPKSAEGMTFSVIPPVPVTQKSFELQLNEDGFGPSDHSSFYGKQIPVLFLFTGTHADYHKPSDTAEKVNYNGLTKIADFTAAIVKAVDANLTRPTYRVAQTAPTGGRMTFNVSLGTIPAYGDGNDGLTIDGAREGSPAAKAGLKAGDKIIKLAGKDVRNISDYMFAMGTMKAGEEYEVIVKRGTETLTLKIVPAPAAPR
jgi:aminopeptidase YwaD